MFRTTLRSLWSHKRRLISTCVAIILGVAFMAGTLVLNGTIGKVFDDLFADIGKGIDVQVRGPVLVKSEFGGDERQPIPESAVAKVQRIPGVAAAEGSVTTVQLTVLDAKGDAMGGNGPPTIVGSWDYDKAMASFQVATGRAPRTDNEAILDVAGAKKGGFERGDKITVLTGKGRTTLTLVGTARFGNADSAGGATFLGTTLKRAQDLAALPGQVNVINARADKGVSAPELVKRIKAAGVSPKASVITGKQASSEQASDVKQGFGFFTTILTVFALIALFVGWFIISNTFSILVAQRTRELALLRAIGATRRQVLGSVMIEAVIVGLIAGVVGLAAGIGLAAGALALLRALGLELPSTSLVIPTSAIVVSIVAGLVVTLVAAIMPAIRATRVPPIAALRDVAIDSSGHSRLRAGIGAALVLAGIVLVRPAFGAEPTTNDIKSVGAGLAAFMIAVLALGPVMARPLARFTGAWIPPIKGITGSLARQNAMRSPRRTASTAAALIIGVALVAFITVFAQSTKSSINTAIGNGFQGDYIVQPANQQSTLGAPPALATNIAKVPGVESVAPFSFLQGTLTPKGEKPSTKGVFFGAIDPTTASRVFSFKMAEGKITDLRPGTLLVDKATARDRNMHIGSEVTVGSTVGKTAKLKVSGISNDPAILGQWTLNRADAARLTPEPTDFLIGIKLEPGTSVDSVRSDLRATVAPYPNLKLQDREQYTSSIVNSITALLNVIYGLLAVSVLISLIGIANTLSLSIHERTRELGLLRAMGMTRRQLRSSVRWEAVIVALIGSVLGIALGIFLSWLLVKVLVGQGITDFAVPVVPMVTITVGAALLAVLASVRPAWRASRLNVLTAIATE